MSDKRIGVVAVMIEDQRQSAQMVNEILSEFAPCVLARLGLPNAEEDLSVIAVVVKLSTQELGAMTGRLGNLPGVSVKSLLTNKCY